MSEVILHISAGQGPDECAWVVSKLAEAFAREAGAEQLHCALIEGEANLPQSVLLSITGPDCEAFAQARSGTIRWIGASPFRPAHKRKNWFVGVSRAPQAADVPELQEADISYQAIRASGPGGQHVNKTDSAIRATHVPTGLTSFSQDQRSQFANKKIARLKLAMQLVEQRTQSAKDGKQALWSQNRELERGNAVRTYEGERFKLRTG
jgi:peptide chain release factor